MHILTYKTKQKSVKTCKIKDEVKTYCRGTSLNWLSLKNDFAPKSAYSLGGHSLGYIDNFVSVQSQTEFQTRLICPN